VARRILIAEDEPSISELLQFLLQREGYETRAVSDGRAVLDAIREHASEILVLDVMLPSYTGYEVLKTVRADVVLRHLPVLMLTARGQENDRRLAEELGVNAFITKPFANAEVIECVSRLARDGVQPDG
jgi:two-component system, OmpR family, response regulator